MHFQYPIKDGDFAQAGFASSQVKKILKKLNIDPIIIKRIVVSLYEAEVNVVAHAYRGTISVEIDPEKVVLCIADQGPGIPNISQAMVVGYSTASSRVREMGFGAGMGLSNIKRNADELKISSEVDQGTTVTITVLLVQRDQG